ncbi:MAG: hypothetical protein KAU58_05180 [Candidatus Omnitrophica bacterium]|nr:hypothetical protein [Candidatus Omnitrophota bacterium]
MKKHIIYIITLILVSIIAVIITVFIFNTRFAELTVDVWAFAVAVFLIAEALYKIFVSKDIFWPYQFMRLIRIIIGVCIFTIHICQIIYGV